MIRLEDLNKTLKAEFPSFSGFQTDHRNNKLYGTITNNKGFPVTVSFDLLDFVSLGSVTKNEKEHSLIIINFLRKKLLNTCLEQ